MTAADFAAWVETMRNDHGWNLSDCERALFGKARGERLDGNQMRRWRTFKNPPHYIALAIAAIMARLGPWQPGGDDAPAVPPPM